MAKGVLGQLLDLARAVASAARTAPPAAPRTAPPPQARDERPAQPSSAPRRSSSSTAKRERPSDRSRLRRVPPSGGAAPREEGYRYAPQADGRPDPGEVVWAWVPYEEDASRGKDRPVLVLDVRGGDDGDVVGLMLTSKDHAGPRTQGERDHDGRRWMDVGTGAWDSQRRPSEVRLDRVLHLPVASVRREGAALPREVFERVVVASRAQ